MSSNKGEKEDFIKQLESCKLTQKCKTSTLNSDVCVDTQKESNQQKSYMKEIEKNYCLPSEEKSKDYIYFPESFEGNPGNWETGGKWMVFALGDLDKIDYAWVVLQGLVRDGTIIAIKSSTSKDTKKGVTMCYTADWTDKKGVKKAADEIRRLIDYEYLMYYKTNSSSTQGKYSNEGSKEICTYMHTRKCGFYERESKHKRWICLNQENEKMT